MGESQTFRIETLDPTMHRREEFDCGVEPLTRYLRERARKEMQSRACACFVAVPASDTGRIAGYYTLSSATITLEDVPEVLAKRLPRYPSLPATLLGRLARNLRFRGAGVGDYLLTDALRRALSNTVVVGSVAVVTDPKDEKAVVFYRRYGFRQVGTAGSRLLLPMGEIAASLRKGGVA